MKALKPQEKFLKKMEILNTIEKLVVENNEEIAMHELALALDIAKGTIYKSFKSKNHLYIELLILNEKRLFELAKLYEYDIELNISSYMIYHMQESNRTVLFHSIEERITSKEIKLRKLFDELYDIREQRIKFLKKLVQAHLKKYQSSISVRDYLSYVWTITIGACMLLSSTYYQKSVGDRSNLMGFYIKQALTL